MKTANYNDVLYAAAELAGRTRDKLPPSEATMLWGIFAADLLDVWNKQPWPDLTPMPLTAVAPVARAFNKYEGNGNPPPAGPLTGQANTNGGPLATFTTTTNHGLSTGMWVIVSGALANTVFNGTFQVTVLNLTNFTYAIPAPGSAFGENNLTVTIPGEMGDILGVYTADPSRTTKCRPVNFSEASNQVLIDEGLAQVFVEYMLPAQDLLLVPQANLAATTLPLRFRNYLALRGAGMLLKTDSQDASAAVYLGLAESNLQGQIARIVTPPWRSFVRGKMNGPLPPK